MPKRPIPPGVKKPQPKPTKRTPAEVLFGKQEKGPKK